MPTRRMFLASAAAAAAAPASALRVTDTKGEKLTVAHGGITLLEYRYSAARPKPYVHPLCLADGTAVSLDGPHDHVHHRGLMFAWSEVNGIDFWGEVNPAPHGSIVHRKFERAAGGAMAEIVAVNDWVADGKTLLAERRTIRIPRPNSAGVFLDWTTELKAAATPVRLAAGSHVYNGLGIRVVPSMDGGAVLNSRGTHTIEAANGEPAEWCAYSGAGMGVAFFDHPSNPRHPNAFFVMNRAFGYMSAAPTFRAPFELAPGGGIGFRWGVLTFRGAPDASALTRRFQSWSKS
jgi:hypothetical protein